MLHCRVSKGSPEKQNQWRGMGVEERQRQNDKVEIHAQTDTHRHTHIEFHSRVSARVIMEAEKSLNLPSAPGDPGLLVM